MAVLCDQWVVAATATSLTDALGLDVGIPITKAYITNKTGAANVLYFGGSTVTNVPAHAGGEVPAAQTKEVGEHEQHYNTDQLFLVGTVNAANIALLTIIY